MKKIVDDIIHSLESFSDPLRIKFASTSYPTSLRVIGVISSNQKMILKELRTQTKSYTGRQKIELAKRLTETDIFECHHIAYEYLGKDKLALNELSIQDIDDMDRNLDNWVLVDCFSAYLLGYAWRENIVSERKIKSYLNSADQWRRRIPVVATVSLNQKARGGYGDATRTLEICEKVVDDHDDKINKALSWALRELAKRDKKPVKKFVQKHKDKLHNKVLREVQHKLIHGTKN